MITTNKTYAVSALIDNVPVPAATESYTPTPHRPLVDTVVKMFSHYGFDATNIVHTIHKKKSRFHTVFDVRSSDLPEDPTLTWQVGILNSYDKSKAIHIVFGGRVFICSNGMILADYKLKTRHTTHVWDRIPDLVGAAASRFESVIRTANERNNRWREQRVGNKRLIDAFAVEVARRGLLPTSKTVEFADEVHNPSFDYGYATDSLFNIHSAYTHMTKSFDPATFARNVVKFDKFLDGAFAVV